MMRGVVGRAALLVVFLSALYSANAQCDCTSDNTVAFKHTQNMECCGSAVDTVEPAGEGFHQHGAISPAGDINGDGTEDFAVSNIEGNVVYVIFGRENETPGANMDLGSGEHGFIIHGEPGETFGSALAGGYDVNSDGFDDLVIGSSGWMDGHGRAFIVFGSDQFPTALNLSDSASGQFVEIRNTNQEVRECTSIQKSGASFNNQCPPFAPTSTGTAEGETQGPYQMNFGLSAAGVGDVNDDGLHDFLVGSHGGTVGAVLVFGRALGASWPEVIDLEDCDGETNCARLIIGADDGKQDLDWGFGMSVTGGTDFNGDGLSDMMIGSPYSYIGSGEFTGLAAVFYGTDVRYEALTDMRSLDGTTGQVIFGIMPRGSFGKAVQALGDISGDGIGDFAISAPGVDYDASFPQPTVYVFFGFGFDETDENIREKTLKLDEASGFNNPLRPTDMFTYPHNGNSQCLINGTEVSCSMGFVIAGATRSGFGSSLGAGDLNNDDKTELIINEARTSSAYILWGQNHADNFTQNWNDKGMVNRTVPLCQQVQSWPQGTEKVCGYMDVTANILVPGSELVTQGEISKVTLGSDPESGEPRALTVIGDINKDSLTDMAYLDGTTLRIIAGQCNDGATDCHRKLNLPEGCKMDLARLMVGFVDDDFIEWGRGYIRYVMEQMETEVRAAWDTNMLDKGFYVKPQGTPNTDLRCWCSPPDQRGIAAGDWLFHCFELDDLICSKPEEVAPAGMEVHPL